MAHNKLLPRTSIGIYLICYGSAVGYHNCVVYTGTHDNDTARGWYESAPAEERDFVLRYLDRERSPKSPTSGAQSACPGRQARETSQSGDFAWDLIRAAWASVATFALAPMQDVLNLGTEARMNYPSRLGGNWEWRMTEGALKEELKEKLKKLNDLYSR